MTGYPWRTGDTLLANDLNAAFAALGGTGFLPLTGGTLIGALTLWADPSAPLQAATKNYVDGLYAVGLPPGGPFLPLAGGTVTGMANFNVGTTHGAAGNNALTITPGANSTSQIVFGSTGWQQIRTIPLNVNAQTVTWTTATSAPATFVSQGSHTSASLISGGINLNQITINSDTLQAGTVNVLNLTSNTSGAAKGGRQGIVAQLYQTTATATGGPFVPLVSIAEGRFSNGGTALTSTTSAGGVFGFNPYARLIAGATNWNGCYGGEIDLSVREPTGVFRKNGLQIVVDSADVGKGVGQDSGLTFATQSGGAGVRDLIELGNQLGQFPLYSSGDTSLMRVYTAQNSLGFGMRANRGIDLLEADIPAWQFRGRGFAVHGSNFVSGAVQIGNGVLQPIANGIKVSSPGNVGTGTPTIAAGGNSYLAADILYDGMGGVYRVSTVSGGAVVSLTVLRQPFVPGAAPANPVATTTWAVQAQGTGCTLNLSWQAGSAVQLGEAGGQIGFGTAPIAKPTVSGAKGSNAALASLLAALAGYGLITDTTTA